MQAPLEICYAGVVIARAEEVREGEGGEFFVVMKDPLPVGTLLGLRSADSLISVRVLHVVESADGAGSGMQVRPAGSDDAGAAMWIPPPPAAKPASSAAATHAPAAVAPPASDGSAPAQAAQAPAAESASESPAAAASEEPAPAGAVATPVASAERAEAAVSVGKEEQPTSVETVPAESAAPAGATDSAAVAEPVPAAVGSSLTGGLEEAAGGESKAASGGAEGSDESYASMEVAAPAQGDLPPARPVQGSGGRRRTKRRR